MTRLAILGAGNMGTAIAQGLLASGWSTTELLLIGRGDKLAHAAGITGVEGSLNPSDASRATDGVLVAVKPAHALDVIGQANVSAPVVMSVAAGVRVSAIQAVCSSAVIRAMPNTPASLRRGVTALCGSEDSGARELAEKVFKSVGATVWVPESDMDAVTAVSGSGPAYLFYLAEAMLNAAISEGLSPDDATVLVTETLSGAAEMLRTGTSPTDLRAAVTSPNGTTAAAMSELEGADFAGIVGRAVRAATRRSAQLGQ